MIKAIIGRTNLPRLPELAVNRLIELKSDQSFAENRRWFSSIDMDLIVWTDDTQSIAAFEFYYDKNFNEHVLIWRKASGFSHLSVDDGEQKPVLNYKEAPVLVPDGIFDPDRIERLFEQFQYSLPAAIARVVRQKLGKLNAAAQGS